MTDPLISVVIPAYNSAALIGDTLQSLAVQTLGDFEILVIDDCSTDGTRALIEAWPDPRVRLIRMESNAGPVLARNRGVAEARGTYIAGLDHDDLCHPERFARQIAYLDAHPETLVVGTAADALHDGRIVPMRSVRRTTPMLLAWLLWIENPMVWSSIMIRGSAARALAPFSRADLLYAEDFDLYHRLAAKGAIARLDDPLLIYRQHDGGVSKRFTAQMMTSGRKVLGALHATRLGAGTDAAVDLIVTYLMGKRAVPDAATLARLGDTVAALHAAFLAERTPSPSDRALIAVETNRRWSAAIALALRSSTIGLRDAWRLRRGVSALALVKPALIGAARRARQTLAEKIIRSGPSPANT